MKTLILYFSQTGTTKSVAEKVAQQLGADLYRITEADAYTSADLDWNNPHSRANREQADDASRPAFEGTLPDIAPYGRVIIGHPIWWGRPPRIIQTVLDQLDLSDKIVASFATSGGSSYVEAQPIMDKYPVQKRIKGAVLNSSSAISRWLKTLD